MPSKGNLDALQERRGGVEEGTKLSARAKVICES